MPIPPRKLPPLKTLIAFEAVARLGTFTAAAKELLVSQAAISQKVRELEVWLGGELITRTRPRMTITQEGEKIAESIRAGVATISRSLEIAQRSKSRKNRVALATTNTFALYWLGSRIDSFYTTHRDIELALITSDREVTERQIEFDIGITFADQAPPGYSSKPLFATDVVAVASKKYLRARPSELEPGQWEDDVLLRLSPEGLLAWPTWLKMVGLAEPRSLRGDSYSSYITLMQAAGAGRGIGLGWRRLIDPILDEGDLVQVGACTARSFGSYYLISNGPINNSTPSGVRALYDWLCQFAEE